jgi:hypothetical protein
MPRPELGVSHASLSVILGVAISFQTSKRVTPFVIHDVIMTEAGSPAAKAQNAAK